MSEVHKKLMEVQSALKAPKSQYNSFGKYHYRNLEDIQEAVKPLLHKHGLTLTIRDEPVVIGERYYIKSIATLTDVESGESVQNEAVAREPQEKKGMDPSQITGATSSYCRKYNLNGLFAIDDTKDADSDGPKSDDEERTNWRKVSREWVQNALKSTVAAIECEDGLALREIFAEIDEDEQKALWDLLNSKQRAEIRRIEKEMKASE